MNEPVGLSIPVGERPINLTQVLKCAGCAQSGGQAKALIADGVVRVNGEVELRKRRQMKAGDTVQLENGPTVVLTEGRDRGASGVPGRSSADSPP